MSRQTAEDEGKGEAVKPAVPKKKVSKRPASHRGIWWTLVHFFGSLRLAMLLFVVIITAIAIGTIQESRFDARVAQHHVYQSVWFTFWLVVLCINLAAAALTRWPWKKRHTGFVVTHTGIIILLIGAIIGKHYGIEGSMILKVGEEPARHLFLAEMAIQFGNPGTDQLYRGAFPLDLAPPSEDHPKYFPVPGYAARSAAAPFARLATRYFNQPPSEPTMVFDRFTDRLVEETKLFASPGSSVSAVRLEMRSAMMGNQPMEIDLVSAPATGSYYDLSGLADITLTPTIEPRFAEMENPSPLMQIRIIDDGSIEYHIVNSSGDIQEGVLEEGGDVATGWADWTVTLREVLPEAKRTVEYYEASSGAQTGGLTGVRGWLDWGDGRKTERRWFVAGDVHTLTVGEEDVQFAFGYRREPLPFTVELMKFEVPRDPGTDTPANFTSYLRFTDLKTGETREDSCGMNRPAVFPGGFHRLLTGLTYKFSQASWNPNDLSESTVQVLRDPGWSLKWIGSLTIVCGIYLIFFARSFRHRRPEDIIDEQNPGRATKAAAEKINGA